MSSNGEVPKATRGRRRIYAVVIGVAVSVCSGVLYVLLSARSSVDPVARQAGEQLATQGRGEIPPCTTCHGQQGQGDFAAGVPRLAGLHPQYMTKQLRDFVRDPVKTRVQLEPIARDYTRTPRLYSDLTVFTPGTRSDAVMSGIARALSEDDITHLATYFGSLPFTATPVAADFETLERGQDLALRGKPEYGLPACASCHGPEQQGFGPDFPPLAGQPPAYIIAQINKWQNGQRDNDHLALMKIVADQLTDGDKVNVATYLANLSYRVNGD